MTKSEKKTVAILLLVIVIFTIIMNRYTEESIQTCIDNGVDPKICEELRD